MTLSFSMIQVAKYLAAVAESLIDDRDNSAEVDALWASLGNDQRCAANELCVLIFGKWVLDAVAPTPEPAKSESESESVTLTESLIRSGINCGAITRAQAVLLGIPWPVSRGWLQAAVGKKVPSHVYYQFLDMKRKR